MTDCKHGNEIGACVHCDLDDACATIARLTSVKRTLEMFARTEMDTVMRHKKLFSGHPPARGISDRCWLFSGLYMTAAYHPDYLRQIIRTALQLIDRWSDEAEELLLMTAAHESCLGRDLQQIGPGPALGIYQMEPSTLVDIYANYLPAREILSLDITRATGTTGPNLHQLQYNPIYSTILARIHYLRIPTKLPPSYDLPAMAEYAKMHYNTPLGAASVEDYILAYHNLVLV